MLLFTAQDLVLFYVGWEVMLIPLFVLMAVWGGEGRACATLRFVIYTMVGSLLMLVAIAAIGVKYHTFEVSQVHSGDRCGCSSSSAAAFCIKAPMFPLHGWLPARVPRVVAGDRRRCSRAWSPRRAPTVCCASACRCSPAPPTTGAGSSSASALAGLLYGSLLAFRQPDARGVVAYSSLGQMNLIIIGIFALNANGSHRGHLPDGEPRPGVAGGVPGDRADRAALRHRRFAYLGGLANNRPRFSTVLLITTMFMLAVPGSSVFVSELYILIGAFQQQAWLGAVAAVRDRARGHVRAALVLGARARGQRRAVGEDTLDLRRSELAIAVPLHRSFCSR